MVDRKDYIPSNAVKITTKNVKAEIYIYEQNGFPCALAFKGRAQKPTFWHRYGSVEARTKAISKWVNDLESHAAMKKARNAARNAEHNLKVGDVFYTSWGYEQTNTEFYVVTELPSPKTVIVQECVAPIVNETGNMSGQRIPRPEELVGEPMRRRVNMSGGYPTIKVNDVATGFLWDGKPKNVSWYG